MRGLYLIGAFFALVLLTIPLPASAGVLDGIVAVVTPHILEVAGVVVAAFITWASTKAREKWGIDIQARHREALHSALMSGARLALSGNLTADAAIQVILDHVRSSVPDALDVLKPTGATLRNLAKSKLSEAQAELERFSNDALTDALRRAGLPA